MQELVFDLGMGMTLLSLKEAIHIKPYPLSKPSAELFGGGVLFLKAFRLGHCNIFVKFDSLEVVMICNRSKPPLGTYICKDILMLTHSVDVLLFEYVNMMDNFFCSSHPCQTGKAFFCSSLASKGNSVILGTDGVPIN